ncbi:aminopeptidase N-like isoform X2 [Nylanderia fulva]|uniref:aminopeptidase N-like isoform X2 n=1 Tax=Nylanderia fulva TaxID=613905 RepID=UPI0010FB029D|nr:aminopeptidase N-like isoform X2 [Nylanderia fulva]
MFATNAVNMIYPDSRIGNLFVVQSQHYSFNLDGDYYMWNSALQVNSSLEIPDFIRAPFILRMMEHLLAEGTWLKFMSLYDKISHFSSSAHLTAIIDKDTRVQLVRMEDWASEKHCPLIKVARSYELMGKTIVWVEYSNTLKIRYVPVSYTTEISPDFDNFTMHFLPVSKHFLFPFEKNGWVIFNIQQVGYYRVNYDDENWRRISHYLNSDDYTKIHVLNRAQIIDDAFHLIIAGQLNSHIFWDLIVYLHRERDYVAWYPMFKAMEYMYGTFSWKTIVENITYIVRYSLYKVLEIIKYEEIDDTDELRICLRQEAARWACFLDSPTCKKKANDKLEQHIQDPKKHKLLPWWKKWTYCNGLMITNNIETWGLVYSIGYDMLIYLQHLLLSLIMYIP